MKLKLYYRIMMKKLQKNRKKYLTTPRISRFGVFLSNNFIYLCIFRIDLVFFKKII